MVCAGCQAINFSVFFPAGHESEVGIGGQAENILEKQKKTMKITI